MCDQKNNTKRVRLVSIEEFKDTMLDVAYQKLKNLHKNIRSLAPKWPTLKSMSSEYECLEWMNGTSVRKVIVVSPVVHGCEYRQKCGCFSCGEAQGVAKTPELALFLRPIVDMILKWRVNEEPPKWICWYVEGSNLNPKECPKEALKIALKLFAEIPSVRRITIESRPEYVTEDVLDLLEKISIEHGIEIEIGIGVETHDDFIRSYCFNKGEDFTWRLFTSSVKKVKERKRIRVLAYVILKPLFLTEGEAIKEAIKTIHQCFQVGVDSISLEIMSIHEFTLVEYFWLRRVYRPPWLWSALEVVNRSYDRGEVRIGGEPPTYYPAPRTTAHNDEKCTARVWETIRRYNETHDVSLFSTLACDCREKWYNIISLEDSTSLEERIISSVDFLSFQDYIIRKLYNSVEGG